VFTLELFTGSPGPDGLVIPDNEGAVGGFLTAVWSPAEKITMSFSVDCATSFLEITQ
jgi:hypothetical protein